MFQRFIQMEWHLLCDSFAYTKTGICVDNQCQHRLHHQALVVAINVPDTEEIYLVPHRLITFDLQRFPGGLIVFPNNTGHMSSGLVHGRVPTCFGTFSKTQVPWVQVRIQPLGSWHRLQHRTPRRQMLCNLWDGKEVAHSLRCWKSAMCWWQGSLERKTVIWHWWVDRCQWYVSAMMQYV